MHPETAGSYTRQEIPKGKKGRVSREATHVELQKPSPTGKWAESVRLLEEFQEGKKKFDCAFDANDPSVQTFHDEKLGVFFVTLAESTEPYALEQAAHIRTDMQLELTRHLQTLTKAGPALTESFPSRMDLDSAVRAEATRAQVALQTSFRVTADTTLARAAIEKRFAWMGNDTEALVRAEHPTIPPSLGAIIHKDRILPETIFGVPLAPPGEKQKLPEKVEWNPENIWFRVSKETDRLRLTLMDAAEAYRLEKKHDAATTEAFLERVRTLQSDPAFKDIHPDVRLIMVEEALGSIPRLGNKEQQDKIEEVLYGLREPDLEEKESSAVARLISVAELARTDKQLSKNGELTEKGVEHIKKNRAFTELSTTAARVVLFDRLQRRGALSPAAARALLSDTRMEIVAQTDQRLTAVIIRANGETVDVSDQLIGKATTRTEEMLYEKVHLTSSAQKALHHISLQSGDMVLFGTRDSAGDTPATTGEIRMEASTSGTTPHEVLRIMKENGFKGAVLRVP